MSYFKKLEQRWPLTIAEYVEIRDIQRALGRIGLDPVLHDPTSIVYRMQAERAVKLHKALELIKDGLWRRRAYALIGLSHLDSASRTTLSSPRGVA